MTSNSELSALFTRLLRENIIPFWMEHAHDRQFGGFHGVLDVEGNPHSDVRKCLVQQARFLWTFAALHRWEPSEAYRQAAGAALDFIEMHMRDPEHGGWYGCVERDGTPIDTSKHLYPQTYLLYGAAEAALAFPDWEQPRNLAEEIFHLIDSKRDVELGGYPDSYARDWTPTPQPPGFGPEGTIKTMNTMLHLVESHTVLEQALGTPLVRQRLSEQIDLFLEHVIDSESWHCRSFFTRDWKVLDAPWSYGHDIEAAWLIHLAAQRRGREEEPAIRAAVEGLASGVLEDGIDWVNGGVLPEEGTDRVWWQQAEGLVGLWDAWKLTGNDRFREAFDNVLAWTVDHQIDWEHGEWHGSVSVEGEPRPGDKGNPWKTPYHTARCCLEMIRRLGS